MEFGTINLDRWNRLTTSIDEGEDVEQNSLLWKWRHKPPAPIEEHTDLHHMGAKLKAHWLGLLGFAAVILVILFCGHSSGMASPDITQE